MAVIRINLIKSLQDSGMVSEERCLMIYQYDPAFGTVKRCKIGRLLSLPVRPVRKVPELNRIVIVFSQQVVIRLVPETKVVYMGK